MTNLCEMQFDPARDSDLRLIIALDYGTTFISIAYASKEQNEPDGVCHRLGCAGPTSICLGAGRGLG
jgi:hypothetical protein